MSANKRKGLGELTEKEYSRYLGPFSADKSLVERLVVEGKIPDLDGPYGVELPKPSAVRAEPWNGRIVVFAAQFDAGLRIPAALLPLEVLTLFGLEVSDLHPSAFVRLAAFEWAMRSAASRLRECRGRRGGRAVGSYAANANLDDDGC